MNKPPDIDPAQSPAGDAPLKRGQSAQAQRDLRSKAALKANMAKRKSQMRGRATEAVEQDSPKNE